MCSHKRAQLLVHEIVGGGAGVFMVETKGADILQRERVLLVDQTGDPINRFSQGANFTCASQISVRLERDPISERT